MLMQLEDVNRVVVVRVGLAIVPLMVSLFVVMVQLVALKRYVGEAHWATAQEVVVVSLRRIHLPKGVRIRINNVGKFDGENRPITR